MNYILDGVTNALGLIFTGDKEVYSIAWVSVKVSFFSSLFASLVGIPLGFIIGVANFRGKRLVEIIFNSLMSLPTIVVGLFLYALLTRRGPFGSLGWLYTTKAMILGQFFIATPILIALIMNAVKGIDPRVGMTAMTLGASKTRYMMTLIADAKYAIGAAVVAGFGRVFGEVGISMMLGGNIKGFTRNIPTAVALETQKGEFALGIALGLILLLVAFIINFVFYYLQMEGSGWLKKRSP